MHMAEGRAQGFDYDYALIDTDAAPVRVCPTLVASARSRGAIAGLNITHPYKQAVMPNCSTDLDADAAALGAVNTVVFKDGRSVGFNTDWSGFSESLNRALPDVRRWAQVVQLGAGGAGSAVAYAILKRDAEAPDDLRQRCRTRARRSGRREWGDLFRKRRVAAGEDLARAMASADGLVNCTPVGMAKYPGTPLPRALLSARLWVADVVYFPLETELLRVARELGCRTVDGGGMAVFQAVDAFRLITGHEPDAERMLAGFREMVA
jgi:shikimate dehydrogenase